jgi:hypothetical protein
MRSADGGRGQPTGTPEFSEHRQRLGFGLNHEPHLQDRTRNATLVDVDLIAVGALARR